MVSERDAQEGKKWRYQSLAELTVANLKRRGITAQFVPTRQEAFTRVLELIPEGATVGRGNSITLHQIGIISHLQKNSPDLFFDPYERDERDVPAVLGKERMTRAMKALCADVFLTSVNAVTMDGKLVSTDGAGNRVGPTIFGPKRVIMVTGANKIVKNLDDAFKRIKEVAAPINAQRLFSRDKIESFADLPCVRTGQCRDCFHHERNCRYTIIIEGERTMWGLTDYVPRIYVIIVGEELGI